MGANVIRVERPGGSMFTATQNTKLDFLNRNKRCISINLKNPGGVDTVLTLLEQADALLEGNRPGVMERLGLGPDICLTRNPALVYGRMTGWGQEGPMARSRTRHQLHRPQWCTTPHWQGRRKARHPTQSCG
jgi:alpha-methylacyl-CoA racemase